MQNLYPRKIKTSETILKSSSVLLCVCQSVCLSVCLCVPKDLTNFWTDMILYCNVITIISTRKILCRRYHGPPKRHQNILNSCQSVLLVLNIALRLFSCHVRFKVLTKVQDASFKIIANKS